MMVRSRCDRWRASKIGSSLDQPLVDPPAVPGEAVAQAIGEVAELLAECREEAIEGARIEKGPHGDAEPGVGPPEGVEAGVRLDDSLALLDGGREGPLADDLVGGTEILQQQ